MNQYTYNQLTDIFKNFSLNQLQVNSFGTGDIANLKGDILYPLMVLNIPTITFLPSQLQYDCQVLVCDRINSDRSNEDEVYSDTVQIISDLYSYLKRANVYDLLIDFDSNLNKATDEINSDWVSGWVLSFKVRTQFNYNVCNIPLAVNPLNITGGTSGAVIPSSYLTCQTVLSCSSLQNALNTKANLSGATFSGNIFAPVITGNTFYSGSTLLSTVIQNIASAYSGSSSASDNFFESGSTGSMAVQLKNSSNQTSGNRNFTLGRYNSNIGGTYGSILNGSSNYNSGIKASVINGSSNRTYTGFALIGNGTGNDIQANAGSSNAGYYSTILNGKQNTISAYHSSIFGGRQNTIAETTSAWIGNGIYNSMIVALSYSHILNGYANNVQANFSWIGNGNTNIIKSQFSTILNGEFNNILSGSHNSILGGNLHTIAAGVNRSAIIGGRSITAYSSDTVYVPSLNIKNLSGNNLSLYINSSGDVYSSASGSTTAAQTNLQNGLNTYTGGTSTNPKVNVSALTINNITVSGSSSFATISATTFYSGSTELSSLFSSGGGISLNQLNTKVSKSGDTMTGLLTVPTFSANSISGISIFSGTTNLNSVFAPINHTHLFSDVLTNGNSDSGKTFVTNSSGILQLTSTGTSFNANFGTGSTNVPQISSIGISGNSEVWTNSTGQLIAKQPGTYLFAYGRLTLSGTGGSADEVIASVLIPGGTLGVNDSISVISVWGGSGAANRVPRVRIGSGATTAATSLVSNSTTNPSIQFYNRIVCKNSSASQETFSLLAGWGSSAAAVVTTSFSLASDIYIVFTMSKTTGSEPWSLNNYDVIINRA